MSDWISVENSLPEDWQHVLVCDVNKESDEYGVEPDVYLPHLYLVVRVVVSLNLKLKVIFGLVQTVLLIDGVT